MTRPDETDDERSVRIPREQREGPDVYQHTLVSAERAGFRFGLLLDVCCAIGAIALFVLFTACETPTEPRYRGSCEAGCSEAVPDPLSPGDVSYWTGRARAFVQAQADSGEIALSVPLERIDDPSIDWRPCPWVCSNCYNTPGGDGRSICAAGSTSKDGGTILVSTWDRERRGPLVEWEARNSFWIRTGNRRLTQVTTNTDGAF